MRSIFSEDGQRLLEAFCLGDALLAFDFDGTLARIVENPVDAALSAQTQKLLGDLSAHATVAIVSGRSERDVRSRIHLNSAHVIGNHGLEGLPDKDDKLIEARRVAESWRKQLMGLPDCVGGVEVEDKTFSLSVHYRKARNKAAALKLIQNGVKALVPPPRAIGGKCVVNLIPHGSPHKGAALLDLMARLGKHSALYLGDDDTDEDVFSLPEPHLLTLRVGLSKDSQAAYFVPRQRDVDRVLKQILEYLPKDRSYAPLAL